MRRPDSAASAGSGGSDEVQGSWRVLARAPAGPRPTSGEKDSGRRISVRPKSGSRIGASLFASNTAADAEAQGGRPSSGKVAGKKEERRVRYPIATLDPPIPLLVLPDGATAAWKLRLQACKATAPEPDALPPLGWYVPQLARATGQGMLELSQQLAQLRDWYCTNAHFVGQNVLQPLLDQALQTCVATCYWLQVILQAVGREELPRVRRESNEGHDSPSAVAGSALAVAKAVMRRQNCSGQHATTNPIELRLGRSAFLQLREVVPHEKPRPATVARGMQGALATLQKEVARIQAYGPVLASTLAQIIAPEAFAATASSTSHEDDGLQGNVTTVLHKAACKTAEHSAELAVLDLKRLLCDQGALPGGGIEDKTRGELEDGVVLKALFLLVPSLDLMADQVGSAYRLLAQTQAYADRPAAAAVPELSREKALQETDEFCRLESTAAEAEAKKADGSVGDSTAARSTTAVDKAGDLTSACAEDERATEPTGTRRSSLGQARAVQAVNRLKKIKKGPTGDLSPRPNDGGRKSTSMKKKAAPSKKK